MNTIALTLVLAAGLAGLAVVLNHAYARLALVELTLNEGLPPGHLTPLASASTSNSVDPTDALTPGVHVFLSRNCFACQRLIDELDQSSMDMAADLYLHYIDRPRPIASAVADRHGATLTEHESELSSRVGADPLPYTIAIGEHALVGRAVSPSLPQVLETARDAGITATRS